MTALIAVSICFGLEKRKSALAIKEAEFFKRQVGFIEVEDPAQIYVRTLLCDLANSWHFRIYLPPEHDYVTEISMGDPDEPARYDFGGKLPAGQFTIMINEVVEFMKPNKIAKQVFVVSSVADLSDVDSLTLTGVAWPDSEARQYRTYRGRFDNRSHQTSLRHGETVRQYKEDEDVTLFEVHEPKEKSGEPTGRVITIKLKSKSKAVFHGVDQISD